MGAAAGAPRILLVEDDSIDRELIRRALARRGGSRVDLRTVGTGDEALDYLQRRGVYADAGRAPRPDLILLDLNLPGTSGLEVLRRIRQTPELRSTPIVVLTSSARSSDMRDSYASGCDSYVVKPLEPAEFLVTFREVLARWLERPAPSDP